MMKMRLLSTVGVVALAIGFAAASAQPTMEKGGNAAGASGGTMEKSPSTGAEHGGAAGENRIPAARPHSNEMQKSQAAPGGQQAQGNPSRPENRAEGREGKPEGRAEGKMDNRAAQRGEDAQRSPADEGRMGSDTTRTSPNRAAERASPNAGKTVGAAGAGGTNLTTEQRTQIRQQVITSGPRADHVNFALNVGTIVPHDVRVAEVPTVIIDMHPEWRGYRYFVVNDEVVIVEPDTLRIVAILDV